MEGKKQRRSAEREGVETSGASSHYSQSSPSPKLHQGVTPADTLDVPEVAHLFLPSSQRPFGEVYELELDTLETTCHVLDPTPLANCSVRQLVDHVSASLWVLLYGGWVGGAWPPRSSKEQLGLIQLMATILASQSAIFFPFFY